MVLKCFEALFDICLRYLTSRGLLTFHSRCTRPFWLPATPDGFDCGWLAGPFLLATFRSTGASTVHAFQHEIATQDEIHRMMNECKWIMNWYGWVRITLKEMNNACSCGSCGKANIWSSAIQIKCRHGFCTSRWPSALWVSYTHWPIYANATTNTQRCDMVWQQVPGTRWYSFVFPRRPHMQEFDGRWQVGSQLDTIAKWTDTGLLLAAVYNRGCSKARSS